MKSTNRILVFTLAAMTVIAVYITINSYYTQLAIYQEKELFKLDCIANAVAYKIDGREHQELVERYPDSNDMSSVRSDSVYRNIFMQIYMARKMTGVPSEIYTITQKEDKHQLFKAISTDSLVWLKELELPAGASGDTMKKGGIIGLFDTPQGEKRLGAVSPIMDAQTGEPAGFLQVEETFTEFIGKAKDQIYLNIGISLFFILLVGSFMFFSVKNMLRRQQMLAMERLELNNLRQELVANVSHDLRTPLASIHGYIETLLMKQDSLDAEQTRKYLNTTLQSTDKLRSLVDELFELSKLESKERKLNVESFSINELAGDVASAFRIQAQDKKVEIDTQMPAGLPRVKADLALIDRTLSNLLSNAVKHCNEGHRITISAEQKADRIWIHVTDTGEGISEQDVPHVFNRFHKGKTPKSGSGLGLAIVKGILDLHKSEYHIQSKLGEGTTFSFSLPVA